MLLSKNIENLSLSGLSQQCDMGVNGGSMVIARTGKPALADAAAVAHSGRICPEWLGFPRSFEDNSYEGERSGLT